VLKLAVDERKKVIDEIEKEDTSFLQVNDSLNMVEGYQQAYTHLWGIIWKSDSIYYVYNFNYLESIEKSVKKVSFSMLGQNEKAIVTHFKNYKDAFFSHIRADMYSANDGIYYFASKYTFKNIPLVQTIAFYH
jgi:hypothetical protein